jgi:hypothetical protein
MFGTFRKYISKYDFSSKIQLKNEVIVAIPYSFWCFGLIKLKYGRSQISSVFELAGVVLTEIR